MDAVLARVAPVRGLGAGSDLIVRLLCSLLLALTWVVPLGCQPEEEPRVSAHNAHACTGSWGVIEDDAVVLYVDVGVDDEGTGSLDAPLSSLQDALDLAQSGAYDAVFVLPGTYSAPVERNRFALTEGHDGLLVAGCGDEMSVIEGTLVPHPDPLQGPTLQPGLEVFGAVSGVEFRGFGMNSVRYAILVRGGAGADQPIVLRNLRIEGALAQGISISGVSTRVVLDEVFLQNVLSEDGYGGWGIAIVPGGSTWDFPTATAEIRGGEVSGATGVGILADGAHVDITGTRVEYTRDYGGYLGRGIQYQNNSSGTICGVEVVGNSDAGIFLHKPDGVVVCDSTVTDTFSASVPGFPVDLLTGDGLAVTQGLFDPDSPGAWLVELRGNRFDDNARAGALVEDVTVRLGDDNLFGGNGLVACPESFPIAPTKDTLFFQGTAVIEGIDGSEPGLPGFALGGDSGFEALELNRQIVDLEMSLE